MPKSFINQPIELPLASASGMWNEHRSSTLASFKPLDKSSGNSKVFF
jgi:hypothetical protein